MGGSSERQLYFESGKIGAGRSPLEATDPFLEQYLLSFVTRNVLPTHYVTGSQHDLELAGVEFGERVEFNEALQFATLPKDWSKRLARNGMTVEVTDERNRVRADCKLDSYGTFIGWATSISLVLAHDVHIVFGNGTVHWAAVCDGKTVYQTPEEEAEHGGYIALMRQSDRHLGEIHGWLDQNRPGWQDFSKYWN